MKIALIGNGIEARSAYAYYMRRDKTTEFVVYDNSSESIWQDKPRVILHKQRDSLQNIDADIVVRPPSVAPGDISTRGVVTSATNEFFATCNKPVVGVTGTKGKGTTSSLIVEILRQAGTTAWLVGNIGISSLDKLDEINAADEGVVVYEMSSFQLWDAKYSPHVAVLLMIEPEHLDIHDNFDDYITAKGNIVRYQQAKDAVVYYADNAVTARLATQSLGEQLPFHVKTGEVHLGDGIVLRRSDVALLGRHNLGNIQAAVLAARRFTNDTAAIVKAVRNFKGLPHRIEDVVACRGVRYINDSFSSAPPATVVAVEAFDEPTVVIMGGYDRGLDFTKTCERIGACNNVKKVLIMGQNRRSIADGFDACSWYNYEFVDSLPHALMRAQELTQSGDVVVFSPGSASFDMFNNFVERGETFKDLVGKLT